MKQKKALPCPCGHPVPFERCCGRWLARLDAPDAEHLMRSRYSAYVRGDNAYLLATWHPATRPQPLDLTGDQAGSKWLGLQVLEHHPVDASHATVKFIARYSVGGRAGRLEEHSRFERVEGHWLYLDALPAKVEIPHHSAPVSVMPIVRGRR